MQLLRLMGMPDKVIGFDSLPEKYLEGLEMCNCTKLGRAWRDFIGPVERTITIKPELDPITRQMRTFPPLKETAPFAYLIDWEINHDKERWGEIMSYVRQNAPSTWKKGEETIRLTDDIEKMAKPLARDAHSELDLEPEDVIVIPLNHVIATPAPAPATPPAPPVPLAPPQTPQPQSPETPKTDILKCKSCEREFDSKQGLLVHTRKMHAQSIAV